MVSCACSATEANHKTYDFSEESGRTLPQVPHRAIILIWMPCQADAFLRAGGMAIGSTWSVFSGSKLLGVATSV